MYNVTLLEKTKIDSVKCRGKILAKDIKFDYIPIVDEWFVYKGICYNVLKVKYYHDYNKIYITCEFVEECM